MPARTQLRNPFVIANPNSAGGKTRREWPSIQDKLERAIGKVDTAFTESPVHATELTRQALARGYHWIIAVGGDGTINEVINGMLAADKAVNADAYFSIVMRGTGNDFRRSLNSSSSLAGDIAALTTAPVRRIDVGKLTYTAHDGSTCVRYFDNIASLGMGGEVDRRVNASRIGKRFGGKAAFLTATLQTLLTYRNKPVRLVVDDVLDETFDVRLALVANGRFGGAGMMLAPHARLDDGLFDIVILHSAGGAMIVRHMPRIYAGTHIGLKNVVVLQGRKIAATSGEEVLLDVDGEAPGRLPATFEILPGVLRVKG